MLYKAPTGSPLADVLVGQGVRRGAGCIHVPCVLAELSVLRARTAQPPRHRAGGLGPRREDPRCWQKEVESRTSSKGKVDGGGEGSWHGT